MIYSLFTKSRLLHLEFSIVQVGQLVFGQTEETFFQNLFLTYMNENGVLRGCFWKRFTAYLQNQRHPLPISIKMAFWPPCWEKGLPFVYRNPVLQTVLSPNSHRKLKTAPPLKNFPHLYEKNRGFGNPFLRLSATYLQFVYRNRPCKQNLHHGRPARPQNEVLILALKKSSFT